MYRRRLALTILAAAALIGCAKQPPATPAAGGGSAFPGAVSPGGGSGGSTTGPTRIDSPPAPVIPNPGAVTGSAVGSSVESINDNSPLKPVFFLYDSDTLDEDARKVLNENAAVLSANGSWNITIEGHCDERGTPEYNLALGDRRALAVQNYLVSIGIPGGRLHTVSYGKEFPFDAGHSESSWVFNRRAHFMLTSK